jgi:hypothetical protein
MPIEWSRPHHRRDKLFFVSCPPNQLVYMLSKPEGHHVLPIHFLEARNRSFPCFDECPHCADGLERRLCTYTDVLVFGRKAGRWYNAILCIGDPSSTLALENYQGMVIEVGRPKNAFDQKRMVVYGTKREPIAPLPHVKPSFDVRPFLLRSWGLYREADLIGCELHVPPQGEQPQESVG